MEITEEQIKYIYKLGTKRNKGSFANGVSCDKELELIIKELNTKGD